MKFGKVICPNDLKSMAISIVVVFSCMAVMVVSLLAPSLHLYVTWPVPSCHISLSMARSLQISRVGLIWI